MIISLKFRHCITKKNRKIELVVNASWLTFLLLNSKELAKILEKYRRENEYLISISDESDKFLKTEKK